ncbi:MAG: TatD family hydrolase [Alphaproteobacteria bacterium]|nr:TatD family hydrolase [Alphaproteobacteria bacterium]
MFDYFNAHCHFLTASTFIPDNVGAVNNSAKISEWDFVIEYAQQSNNIYAAIGIHPWYIDGLPNNWDVLLQDKLLAYPDLTVGEIGLDNKYANMDAQIDVFMRQIVIANALKRGLHIHCVGVWDKIEVILKNQKFADIPFILFHRFNGVISDWLGMEKVYFSYSPVKSMKRIAETPQNRLLLETDSENVADIVQWTNRVADECKISKDVFVNNAKRMFGNG